MLEKLLNIERIIYRSSDSRQTIEAKLEKIFKNERLGFQHNISGKFISANEFKAADNWTIGVSIRSFEKDPAYLKGKIFDEGKGTILRIRVRPNSIFPLFSIIFPVGGFIAAFTSDFDSGLMEDGLPSLVFILVGLISYWLGGLLKSRLKRKIELYLGLSKIDYCEEKNLNALEPKQNANAGLVV